MRHLEDARRQGLSQVIPAVRGIDRGITFVASDPAALAAGDIPLFFLALPHGAASEYAKALVGSGKRVIDLSADFRVSDLATYERYYGKHHAPELLPFARYVLPEITPPSWKEGAKIVASPGCYPTSILVPLVPLLRDGIVIEAAHCRQQLQRGERRGPEGRRGVPLRGAHGERQGLRPGEA